MAFNWDNDKPCCLVRLVPPGEMCTWDADKCRLTEEKGCNCNKQGNLSLCPAGSAAALYVPDREFQHCESKHVEFR